LPGKIWLAPVGGRGITVGEAILVKTMNKNGFTAEQIAAATDKDVEEVEAILAGGEPVFA
jgi:predicted aconitase with swiveling domain